MTLERALCIYVQCPDGSSFNFVGKKNGRRRTIAVDSSRGTKPVTFSGAGALGQVLIQSHGIFCDPWEFAGIDGITKSNMASVQRH